MKPAKRISAHALEASELVLNSKDSIYHLALKPHELADKVIVVGDMERVKRISRHFQKIEHRVAHREFLTHTGIYGGVRITVLSTGIGTDNIDIVLNELDALRNIDLETRTPKIDLNPLEIIRIGTSGALNAGIEVGSFVHSKYAIGLDPVMHFYDVDYDDDELELVAAFQKHTLWPLQGITPYAVRSDPTLGGLFTDGFTPGITATSAGFYGPQGRALRLPLAAPDLNTAMATFRFKGVDMANYEMESSALFALGGALGHKCTTVCVVIANRMRKEFLADYQPKIDELIATVLDALTSR